MVGNICFASVDLNLVWKYRILNHAARKLKLQNKTKIRKALMLVTFWHQRERCLLSETLLSADDF